VLEGMRHVVDSLYAFVVSGGGGALYARSAASGGEAWDVC